MKIDEATKKLVKGKNLSIKEMQSVFNQIMSGKTTSGQMASFLTALRIKTETVNEITGAAIVMRKKSEKVKIKDKNLLDTCGTGGTGTGVFNVSTISAFVLAGAGIKIAKHGNRAASGKCGSADVLEELGVKINISTKLVEKCIDEIGIGFMFAPIFHGAMKYAIETRREMGIRTIFNVLGPLCNPASSKFQVLGVYSSDLTELVAKVLKKLGSKRAFVVCGKDPLDEVTITGTTKISELSNGKVKTYTVTPATFGIKKRKLELVKGGNSKVNAKIARDVLNGKLGAKRDIVLMNASLGFVCMGKAKNFKEGVKLAANVIDSGKAKDKLSCLINMTNTKKAM